MFRGSDRKEVFAKAAEKHSLTTKTWDQVTRMSFDHRRIFSACAFRHEAYVIKGEKFNSPTHVYHHFDSRLKLSTSFSTWTEAASVRGNDRDFRGVRRQSGVVEFNGADFFRKKS